MTDQLRENQRNWHNAQDQVWKFLGDLQRYLNAHIPERDEVVQTLKDVVS